MKLSAAARAERPFPIGSAGGRSLRHPRLAGICRNAHFYEALPRCTPALSPPAVLLPLRQQTAGRYSTSFGVVNVTRGDTGPPFRRNVVPLQECLGPPGALPPRPHPDFGNPRRVRHTNPAAMETARWLRSEARSRSTPGGCATAPARPLPSTPWDAPRSPRELATIAREFSRNCAACRALWARHNAVDTPNSPCIIRCHRMASRPRCLARFHLHRVAYLAHIRGAGGEPRDLHALLAVRSEAHELATCAMIEPCSRPEAGARLSSHRQG